MTLRILAAFAVVCACAFGVAEAQSGPSLTPAKPATAAAGPTLPTPTARAQLDRADLESWLDGYMPYALQRGDVAGAVVVVVKDGRVLLQKGYGYADVATRTPVDPATTMFRPGSVSKLFTWTALMQMVEQGKLDLDRDINTYLDFRIPPYRGRPITARNLLTHTSGFEETIKGLITDDPRRIAPLGETLKRWIPARIFPPGEVPAYSNYGAALGGYLVERLSGQSFDDYLDQHIFGVLGMHDATFRQPPPLALRHLMASAYPAASGKAQPYELIALAPAGSSAVAGGDMARFMIAHLQDGAFEGRRILQPATARMMHATPLTTINPALHRMLLGFYETDRNGHRAIGHGGDTRFFHSDLELLPDDHVGVFVSLNSLGKEGAAGAIRTALFDGFVDRYFPGPARGGHVDAGVARADARLMAGTYDDSRRAQSSFMSLLNLIGPVTATADADGHVTTSILKGLNGAAQTFEEIGPRLWREVGGKDLLGAKIVDGRVAMWSGGELSPFMVFQPAPAWRNPAWLMPALQISLAALLLTGGLWPVIAIVRRRYGAAFALRGSAAASYRLVRGGSLVAAALMIGWLVTVVTMLQTFAVTSAMDPWILTLHLLTTLVFPLLVGVAAWDVWAVWTRRAGWRGAFARTWSVVVLASASTLLWVGLVYHLVGFTLNY